MTINEMLHEIPHMRYRLESTKHKETLDEIEEVLRHHKEINDERNEMIDIVHEIIEMDKWIPMTTRPMTDEEREHYREWSDIEEAMIFDCELPEDGQEVLVSYGGYVCVDTFCKDDGCYFEGVDIDDVEAWMPLPKPYEPKEGDDEWDRVTMIDINGNTHKVTFKKEDIGDYPDEIPNQFDNLTGSMNV